MSDISEYVLMIILNCCFLVAVSQTTNLTRTPLEQNQTNNSQSIREEEKEITNHAILNYDFFSYDVIDHRTLLVKFDLTHSIFYQQSKFVYDAQLYVSKIPALNYKINIGPFTGYYETQINGTIVDHFTFCLVLTPNVQQQSIGHYCTKLGPDEDRHRHPKKQGTEGDHILLLLQIMMIGIFLAIIQIAHIMRNRKYRQWHLPSFDRVRHERPSVSPDGLGLLRFRTIDEEESQEQEEEEEEEMVMKEEDSSDSSHRQLPSPIIKPKRSRSPSPSADRMDPNPDDSFIEHILESKPWIQIPK